MCFSLKCCKFCYSAGVWPAIVYTHWHRGGTERGQSPQYILKSSKKTIFDEMEFYVMSLNVLHLGRRIVLRQNLAYLCLPCESQNFCNTKCSNAYPRWTLKTCHIISPLKICVFLIIFTYVHTYVYTSSGKWCKWKSSAN